MNNVSFPARMLRLAPLAGALALGLSSAATAAPKTDPYARQLMQRQLRASGALPAAATTPVGPNATLPVTSCADDTDPGTLRNVLATAGEGDVIDLSALTCSTITLTQGEIDLSNYGPHQILDLTLLGPGESSLAIDANEGQAFAHGENLVGHGTLTIKNLTIRNGNYTHGLASCVRSSGNVVLEHVTITDCHASNGGPLTFGGATSVSGKLTMISSTISASSSAAAGDNVAMGGAAYVGDLEMIDSTVSGNSVSAAVGSADDRYYLTAGGGLYVRGDLVLTNSTISGNSVSADSIVDGAIGGGVFVRGVVSIDGSTLDGNRAKGSGGGVFKDVFSVFGDPPPPQDTRIAITNSTIYGNTAGLSGAGIFSMRPTTISSSTVAGNGNATGNGAGLLFADTTLPLEIQSSIFWRNEVLDVGSPPPRSDIATLDVQAPLTILGANILAGTATPNITLPSDTIASDPLLLPLASNGGPTRTLALGTGSPAIDAGNNAAALEFDQRGEHFARVSGAAADIGAFEWQQPPPNDDLIFKDGFDGAALATFEYAYDDGDATADGGNIGPPSSFDPDMLWGNYYTVQPGGDFITKISIAFGPTFPSLANGPVTFWLLEDADGDGDPRNAYAIASVQGTPNVFNDEFFSVDIPPTWVQTAFFVGASAKLDGGQDRPARIDGAGPAETSWFFYAPDIAATIDDLAAAPYGVRVSESGVLRPGAFMVRATGQAAD